MLIEIVKQGAEIVGGLGKLAAGLGVKHPTFYSWKRVPPERVLDFERITGISRHLLRPDLYGELPAADTSIDGPCTVAAGPLGPHARAGQPISGADL